MQRVTLKEEMLPAMLLELLHRLVLLLLSFGHLLLVLLSLLL